MFENAEARSLNVRLNTSAQVKSFEVMLSISAETSCTGIDRKRGAAANYGIVCKGVDLVLNETHPVPSITVLLTFLFAKSTTKCHFAPRVFEELQPRDGFCS